MIERIAWYALSYEFKFFALIGVIVISLMSIVAEEKSRPPRTVPSMSEMRGECSAVDYSKLLEGGSSWKVVCSE